MYLTPEELGFVGVLKQRFVDFMVQEVDTNGNVVRLTDVPREPEPKDHDREPLTFAGYLAGSRHLDGMVALYNAAGQPAVTALETFLAEGGKRGGPRYALLPPVADKETRRKVHYVLKEYFPAFDADTKDDPAGSGGKCLRLRFAKRGAKSIRYRHEWPAGAPPYLQFVLYKQNCDTAQAIANICRRLDLRDGKFGYAGLKDKRAVTTQLVTVHKVAAENLRKMNDVRNDTLAVGNFTYVDQQLRLGDLTGNRFTIVLRNCSKSREHIERALLAWKDSGFINYFGLQRFGTTAVPTHHVGRAVLNGNWDLAAELIMKPRNGERDDVRQARQHFLDTRDAYAVLNQLPMFMRIERAFLEEYARCGSNKQAFARIPFRMRKLYVHAYQSWIWNLTVTERLKELGAQPVEGDLVIRDSAAAAAAAAADIADDAGADDGGADDDAVMEGEATATSFSAHQATLPEVHVLTAADVASGKFDITDIVLPLPGYEVTYPTHAFGKARMYAVVQDDGVDFDDVFGRNTGELGLAGAYRFLVQRARDVEWEFHNYIDHTEPLVDTDVELMKRAGTWGTVEAPEPETPVAAPPADDPMTGGAGGEADGAAAAAAPAPTPPPAPTPTPTLLASPALAVKVSFTLGRSCYATMCLRELLKQSTAQGAHAKMTLDAHGAPQATILEATKRPAEGTEGTGAGAGAEDKAASAPASKRARVEEE